MARALPRISFNSSTFIRLLSELAGADVEASTQPFAERLGLWLDWTAAMPLSAALQASAAAPLVGAALASGAAAAAKAITLARAELSHSIATDSVLTSGTAAAAGPHQPTPATGGPTDNGVDFLTYRRCYQAHQRLMQARIAPLRAQARNALAARSPALAKLAALDSVLDEALGARERNLLASVPALLERRFERLQQAHLGAQATTPAPEGPAPAPQSHDWLAGYCKEMQGVLLAEMDIRLQPTWGLVETLCNEVTRQT